MGVAGNRVPRAAWWLDSSPHAAWPCHLHASHRRNMPITRDEANKACCAVLHDNTKEEQQVELGKLLSFVADLPMERLDNMPVGISSIAVVSFLRTQMAGW